MITIVSHMVTGLCSAEDAVSPSVASTVSTVASGSTAAVTTTSAISVFDTVYPLTLLALLALAVPIGMLATNWFLSRWAVGFKNANTGRDVPVESGLSSTIGGAGDRFDIKFYLIAMLFLVFDIEVAFLYPWAMRFAQGGWEMVGLLVVFLILLEAGYFYLYKKGAFDWDR